STVSTSLTSAGSGSCQRKPLYAEGAGVVRFTRSFCPGGGPFYALISTEARLIALACSKPPEGRNEWTMQLLADKLVELQVVDSVCDETVRRALKKTRSSRG